MAKSKFSLVLRKYRKNAGLTQKQVAEALNVERSTYAYYETGTTHPSGLMIMRLAKILNVDYKIFMEAVGDEDFDNKPEDPEYTTLSDSSAAEREKMYTIEKYEQNLLMIVRLLTLDQREDVIKLAEKYKNENLAKAKSASVSDE